MARTDQAKAARCASLRRWGDLLAYLAVGAALVAATGAWWIPGDQSAVFAVSDQPAYGVALLLLTAVLVWRAGAGRWRAPLDLGLVRRYPPPWVAVVGGLAVLGAWLALRPADLVLLGYRAADGSAHAGRWPFWVALAPAAFALVVFAVAWVLPALRSWGSHQRRGAPTAGGQDQPPKSSPEPSPTLGDLAQDFEGLCDWLRSDDEIAEPADDRFGHHRIALRITRELRSLAKSDDARGRAVALLGEVGSGKSSTLELVRYEFEQHAPDTLFVRISLWVFDSAQAAVAGVLEGMLGALATRVSVLGLRGLPEAYLHLISSGGGLASAIAQALRPRLSPSELLAGIGDRLQATGLQLVVAIEDLERFADHHDGRAAGEHAIDRERVAPIQALLHLLDRVPRVSVLLAAASLEVWPELAKVARSIERIPTIEPEQALPLLRCFHQCCATMRQADGSALIDPADPHKRQELEDFLPDGKVGVARALLDSFPNTRQLPWALAEFCAVPRAMKFALRECLYVWEQLKGELDLDDLLAISLLRQAEPQVFAWVEAHLSHLRGTQRHRKGSTRPNPGQQAEQALDGIVGPEDASPRRGRVDAVLELIFPTKRSHSSGGDPAELAAMRAPQGFAVPGVEDADYWRRYLRREPMPWPPSDQRVLRAITTWQETQGQDGGALVELLAAPGPAYRVMSFARLFRDASELQRLLEQVVKALGSQQDPRPTHDEGFGPLNAVWNALLRRGWVPGETKMHRKLGQLVSCLVEWSASRNLTLAWELTHLFATSAADGPPSLPEEEAKPIRETLQASLVTHFVGVPELARALLTALRGSDWCLLYWCSWTLPRIRAGELAGLPFERWPDLVATIVAAARLDPKTALPQLLPFLVKDDASRRSSSFDEDAARRLLGPHYDEVLAMFRSGAAPPPPEADPAWRAADAAVRTHAGTSEAR